MSKAKRNLFSGFNGLEILLIITLLLFAAVGPYLFTQFNLFGFSFDETGPIGDTIGGITAPFINLFAAFLVYKSFKEQIKANSLLSKETNHNYILSLTNSVSDLIKSSFYLHNNYLKTSYCIDILYNQVSKANTSNRKINLDHIDAEDLQHFTDLVPIFESLVYLKEEVTFSSKDLRQKRFHLNKINRILEDIELEELYNKLVEFNSQIETPKSNIEKDFFKRLEGQLELILYRNNY